MSNSDWDQQLILADELHKLITRNFPKRTVISNSVDEIWSAHLIEMRMFSKWNNEVKYLLMVIIDVVSNNGCIKPLKDKKTEVITKTFAEIFKTSKRKPKK